MTGKLPDAIARQFGANLRRLRLKAGLSQERLAPLARIYQPEISVLERGEREPGIGTLLKLAGPLEVNPLELLEGIVWHWDSEDPEARGFYVRDERVR